jgi:O-antigen ligase
MTPQSFLTGFRRPWAGRPWLSLFATRPRFLALAAFLFAGDLKADPRLAWVPVDLTLLTGAILSLVLAARAARGFRVASRAALLLLGLWWLTFLPGVWGSVDSPYGVQKVATLFSFTLLSALAPLWLLGGEGDLRGMVNALAGFCLAITLAGLFGAGHGEARLQAFGSGTIALGRATGLLFLHAVLALAEGPSAPIPVGKAVGSAVSWVRSGARLAKAGPFAVMTLAGIAAVFTGSRGPIVAALLVLLLVFGLGRQRLGRRGLELILAGGLLVALVAASLSFAPAGSLRRLDTFVHGQYGGSERYRVQALDQAWEQIRQAPAGLGWGRFATRVDPEKGLGRQYPHNLLAEVALEGGWACAAATVLVLVTAVLIAWSRTASGVGRIAFSGLLFYLVNAMVSGDVNDNRPLFMFISSALALGEVRR